MRQVMAPEEPPAADPDRDGALGEAHSSHAIDFGADDAIWTGPPGHEQRADDRHQTRVGLQEDLHQNERDQRGRHGGGELSERLGRDSRRSPPAAHRSQQRAGDDASRAA